MQPCIRCAHFRTTPKEDINLSRVKMSFERLRVDSWMDSLSLMFSDIKHMRNEIFSSAVLLFIDQ